EAPATRMRQRVVGTHGGGPGPHFVIEIRGRRRVWRIGGVAHVVVAADLDQPDLSQPALLENGVAGLDNVRRAAPLRADLYVAFVFASGGQHGLRLHDVDADGFLAVHIGARFDGGDHG